MVEKKLIASKDWLQIEHLTRAALTAAEIPHTDEPPHLPGLTP